MSDNVNNNEDQLKESQNEADLIENTNGILTEPNLIEDEVLAEIEAIQAAIAEDETPIEEIETAAGENSDGGSSSAVDFTRDGSETLASTDFQTASFAFNAVTNEFIDTNNFVLTTTNNADTSGSTPSIIGTTTSPSSPIVPSADSSLSAQFTDNFVSGVSYNTSSGLSGFTGDTGTAGEFKYNIGDVITFKVGDVIIAEFNADAINGDILFLQDISGHDLTENNASHIENMAIFLQGLDSDLSDLNSADGILRTDSLVNNEASYATNITISEAIHEAFINYIDPTTGLPLDITSSGKEMVSQALASVGIEFTRDTERDESGENTFESIAMEHVTETIQELAGDRTPEQADEREIDTIEVPGGLINFNFQEADGVITFTTDDLLVGAIGQQVITANLLVDNVRLSAAFENIGTLVDNGDGNYEIQLNEGVTGKELEGLAIDYRVEDWTVSKEVTSQTLDSFKSHLSANIEDVQEDAGFNQFTLNSTLSFQQDSQLQINFSSELLSQQLTAQITQELADLGKTAVTENGVLQIAEYADDFTVPLEYSNDGGVTWTAMTVVSIDTTGNIPRPIFGFELASGNSSVEIRVPIFDDVTEEPTEYFRAEISGDNFYGETIIFAIEDNDSVASVLPQIDIDYVLITEGQGEAIFTLTLSEKSDDVITVEYDTAELSAKFGVDFEATSGIAIFQPGQTTAEIKIAIVDDLISEISPEFALINLSNATNAVINDAQGTLRIFDNDYPVNLSVSSPEVNEGEQAVFTVNIEKELGGKPESLALVNLSLSNGTAIDPQDFDSSTLRVFYGETSNPQYLDFDGRGNVILPIGVTSLTVIVDTVNDSVFEQSEDFSLTVKVANAQATGNVTILDNDTNLAPTLTAENGQMDEDDGSVTVKFEAKDTDGTIVSTVATVPAEQGTVVVNDDGTYTFTPVKDFNGEATITLVTEDSEGATSSTTSKVVVNAINDKPSEIVLDNLTVNENDIGAVIGKLSTTDLDDGDSHSYSVDDTRFEVVNGELKLKEGISLDHETQDSIVVKVTSTDSGQLSTEQSFTIAVGDVNESPIAVDDNEIDSGMLITLDSAPLQGVVEIKDFAGSWVTMIVGSPYSADSEIKYVPDAGYPGNLEPVVLTTTYADGTQISKSFSLAAGNSGEVFLESNLISTDEDTAVTIDVLSNDSDPEGDSLFITHVQGHDFVTDGNVATIVNGSGETVGTAIIVSVDGKPQIQFTPDPSLQFLDDGEEVTVNFSYEISDGQGGTATADVSVVVHGDNDAPELITPTQPLNYTTDEDTPLIINESDILARFTDADGDVLSIASLSVDSGDIVDNNDGTWTFTPANNSDNDPKLTIKVTDGKDVTVTETNIVVDAVADAPVVTVSISDGQERALPFDYTKTVNEIISQTTAKISGTDSSDQLYSPEQLQPDWEKVAVNEYFEGKGGNDSIIANNGNDVIFGGAGDDSIYGGDPATLDHLADGFDTAIYTGKFEDYDINIVNSGSNITTHITDLRNIEQSLKDTSEVGENIYSIEQLIFSDAIYVIDNGVFVKQENTVFDYHVDINALLVDTDTSEGLSLTIAGVPTGATLSQGTLNTDGTWTIPVATSESSFSETITMTLAKDSNFELTVTATATESSNGSQATTSTVVKHVAFDALNADTNTITEDGVGTGNVLENDFVLTPTLATFSIEGDTATYSVNNPATISGVGEITFNENGSYIFTPVANYAGVVPIITYTTTSGLSNTLTINVTPVADALNNNDISIIIGEQITGSDIDPNEIPDGNNGSVIFSDGTVMMGTINSGGGVLSYNPGNGFGVTSESGQSQGRINDDEQVALTFPAAMQQLDVSLKNASKDNAIIKTESIAIDISSNNLVAVSGYLESDSTPLSDATVTLTLHLADSTTLDAIATVNANGTWNITDYDAGQSVISADLTWNISGAALGKGNAEHDLTLKVDAEFDNLTFTSIADDGYQITNISVSQGVDSSYTYPLEINTILADSDNSEILKSVTISDLPDGSSIAVVNSDGTETVITAVDGIFTLDTSLLVNSFDGLTFIDNIFLTTEDPLQPSYLPTISIITTDSADSITDEAQNVFGSTEGTTLTGNDSVDFIHGGGGDDTIIGGSGNDLLIGDGGADTFVWLDGEVGTDHIQDFNQLVGDKLDLSDLLHLTDGDNLDNFLDFESNNGDTTIDVMAEGDGVVTQTIILDGVDLGSDDVTIINDLLSKDNGDSALFIGDNVSVDSTTMEISIDENI